jgi:hypothetical protein
MKKIFIFITFFMISLPVMSGEEKIVRIIYFDDYEVGSEEDWLKQKGFEFEQDAHYRNRVSLAIDDHRLTLEAKRRSYGIMPNETVNISEFSYVEVDWGVNRFPTGASYEQNVRNEAIMLMIFMGDEKKPSGSIFIPDSPYFIGLYLCHGDDRINYPYIGAYFKKTGRYVCVDRPETGETVTTRFNLLEGYRDYFDKERDDDPGISGIALALDTKKAGDGGRSSAFIREIRFYR